MYTNQDIMRIAMRQSAADLNCEEEDFLKKENLVTMMVPGLADRKDSVSWKERLPEENDVLWKESIPCERGIPCEKRIPGKYGAPKKYYKAPIACNFVSYGNNIVASAAEDYINIVNEYIGKFEYFHCFETPNMHWLNDRMQELGQRVCFMAEYFLPDVDKLQKRPCPYETKLLGQEDFTNLYLPQWGNALCADRKELDVLGIGAYDGGELIGFAACSADCDGMWQIGVDVLEAYRRQGIASALTANLAVEILERGKVPFYCCAWSNIRSAKNAIRSGFSPAWVEMTVKPAEMVAEMNK